MTEKPRVRRATCQSFGRAQREHYPMSTGRPE